ncbi:MAG: hypothetical protein KJ927_11515, partial [Candidatus Eisenbacteria bacterium]|nr:hypothetical protein [Candidatus Eisenbacteria bacterium]
IVDVTGRRVRRFDSSELSPGASLEWNRTDEEGRSLQAGVYWVQARSENREEVRRIVLLPPQ